MTDIRETNEALERHMVETKSRDAVLAVVCGIVIGFTIHFLLGTGGPGPSGGISPTITERDPWPMLGALAGLVGGAASAWAIYRHRRQQRRRRFWGL